MKSRKVLVFFSAPWPSLVLCVASLGAIEEHLTLRVSALRTIVSYLHFEARNAQLVLNCKFVEKVFGIEKEQCVTALFSHEVKCSCWMIHACVGFTPDDNTTNYPSRNRYCV